jgi:hypothetical protein
MGKNILIKFTNTDMKTYLFLIWIIVVAACSDKYTSLYHAAPVPALAFNKLHDSMYIREKDPNNITGWLNPYLWMRATPSMQQMNIQYSDTSGRVHFVYRGVLMEDSKPIIVAGDSTSMFCHCDTAGVYTVDFYLTDQLGKVSSRTLYVNCLANDRAKPDLFLDFIDSTGIDNWSFRLDATRTSKLYGRIMGYYFSVDGVSLFSPTAVGHWVFHSRGEHTASLYVIDDLGLHSDTVTQKIMIP